MEATCAGGGYELMKELTNMPTCVRCHKYFKNPKELEKHLALLRKENDFFHFPNGVDLSDKVEE